MDLRFYGDRHRVVVETMEIISISKDIMFTSTSFRVLGRCTVHPSVGSNPISYQGFSHRPLGEVFPQ